MPIADVGGDDAVAAAEGGIERAVGGVADERKVVVAAVIAVACDDDLPVRLDRDAPAPIVIRTNVGRDFAAGAEGRVERAIGVVTHQREVVVRTVGGSAPDHDLPVGLDCDADPPIVTRTNGGRDLAASAEGGVERAIGVVTHQRELIDTVGGGAPDHDLPVGLDCDAQAKIVTRTNGGGDLASGAEGGVERSIGVVTHQRELIDATD